MGEYTMTKALYFPHTDIGSPVIIKNALLLWDGIETIIDSTDVKIEEKVTCLVEAILVRAQR
jgi:hypothetical protein